MTFSLIMATLGRTDEPRRFLDSLESQTFRDFELILADQNDDDRIAPLLAGRNFKTTRITSKKGLSRARNAALPLAKGDIIAFPDDDCTYAPHTLAAVAETFATRPGLDGIIDNFGNIPPKITRYSVFKNAPSWAFFLRKDVVDAVGIFDEDYGLGPDAKWPSAEDSDFLVRALAAKARLERAAGLGIWHPEASRKTFTAEKIESYGVARMALLRKHGYPEWFKLANAAYPVLKMAISPGNAAYFFHMAKGRIKGLFAP